MKLTVSVSVQCSFLACFIVSAGTIVLPESSHEERQFPSVNTGYEGRAPPTEQRPRRNAPAAHALIPDIQPFSFSKNTALGQRASVACVVIGGQGPFRFEWSHNNRRIGNTATRHAKEDTANIATLTLDKVSAEDLGNYTCSVTNAHGSDSYTAPLVVEAAEWFKPTRVWWHAVPEAPQIQPFAFPKNPRVNTKIVVSCNAHIGSEPIHFAWFKNGRELLSENDVLAKMFSETVSILTLPKVSSKDVGNYTCQATNRFGTDSLTAELVLTELPKLQPFFFPKDHPIGKDLTVSCFATEGQPPLSYVWLKDFEELVSPPKFDVKHPLDKMSTLTIREVSAADIGNYTCVASNDAGSDRFTASLIVTVEPPKVQRFTFPTNDVMPKKVIVHCAVLEGSEPLSFVWTKDGHQVASGRRLHVKQLSETVSSLTITEVGAADIGNYTCTVSNAAGSDSATSLLVVKGLPVIVPFSFVKNPVMGQKTTVTCVVGSGVGPFHFVWTHGGTAINSDSRKHVKVFSDNVAALTIEAIAAKDVGNYTCTVSNAAGSASHTTALLVEAPPVIMPISFAKNIALGEKILLTCAVTRGTPPFDIRWSHEGRPVANTKNKYTASVTGSIATMTIEKVTAEDVGNYTCTADNDVGRDAATATLMVEGNNRGSGGTSREQNKTDGEVPLSNRVSRTVPDVALVVHLEGPSRLSDVINRRRATRPAWHDSRSRLFPYRTRFDMAHQLSLSVIFAAWFFASCYSADHGLPVIVPFSFVRNPVLGQKTTVTCVVGSGAGPYHFVWTHRGTAINSDSRKHVKVFSENVAALTIEAIAAKDVGNYTCTVSNAAGSASHTAALLVEAPPVIMPISFAKNIALGEKILLTCAVTRGTPPFDIRWSHEGRPVANTKNKYTASVTGSIATMTIEKVTAEDVGSYTCTADNDVGRDAATATLMVEGTHCGTHCGTHYGTDYGTHQASHDFFTGIVSLKPGYHSLMAQ
ncbi:hypothetical protein V5799_007338 [Amblyomma americanum]|uniref:Ig-like domain-containing protein n=1 Tax=Amblyomma americanum TaxID=6943 RepID=A0AAQ4DTU0_AMBAM